MLIGKNRDEEKRSKAWYAVVLTSSALILIVIVYFATRFLGKNPLEGAWTEDEYGYFLEIKDGKLTWEGIVNEVCAEVELEYTMDKGTRILTIKPSTSSFKDASENAGEELTPQEIKEALDGFTKSFDYSLDDDKLTLTEREYGEQFSFTRVSD